ncbi:MAG: tetratricopeptide repeat protein [Acidobacteria bacterium]|nr:tetratricopeptide repeat protein [Acidobacteriota bacterium]
MMVLLVLLTGCLGAGRPDTATAASSSEGKAAIGLVVESVRAGSAAATAGVTTGDILQEWSNGQTVKPFLSPFDFLAVEREQGPRGPVGLRIRRGKENIQCTLIGDDWGMRVRPPWPAPVELSYLAGLAAWCDGSCQQATGHWAGLIHKMSEQPHQRNHAAWLAYRLGERLAEAGQYDEAANWLRRAAEWAGPTEPLAAGLAVELALAEVAVIHNDLDAAATALARALSFLPEDSTPGFSRALVLFEQGKLAARQGNLDMAAERFDAALAQCRTWAADSRLAGRILYSQGTVVWRRGRMDEAERLFQQSLTMLEKVAPAGLDMANSLNGLGAVAWRRGDMSAAETYYGRALDIRRREDPLSRSTAGSLNNLGNVAWNRGDLARAEEYYRQSMEIYRNLAPNSLELAHSLHNLAGVSRRRGHLLDAEGYYRQALAIRQEQAPSSGDTAATLNNLGIVALKRGHPALAEEYFRQALTIRHEQAPGSLMEAASLNNLGTVAEWRGDWNQAESYLTRALEIKRRQAPDSLDIASTLQNLGALAVAQGNYAAATESYTQALALKERLAPGSLDTAVTLNSFGLLAWQQGDLPAAAEWLLRAMAIRERLAPGSRELAETYDNLARVYQQSGDLAAARRHLELAVSAFEIQLGRMGGGDELRQRFSAAFADSYRRLIALQLDQPVEAFRTLERFRGQVLREMLARRDLVFTRDLPAELIREQGRLKTELDRLNQSLAVASPEKEPERVGELLQRLHQLTVQEQDIRRKIEHQAPRLAELCDPRPVEPERFREVLPADTLFLSYCTGPEELQIFCLLNGELTVHRVAVERETLQRAVWFLRLLLTHPDYPEPWIRHKGQELAGYLLEPVRPLLAHARRVMVCPDGPLHLLPFAALPLADGYLVEQHPVSRVISATMWTAMRQAPREAKAQVRLVAFGAPAVTSAWPLPAAGTRATESLPASRREVEGILALFGAEARVFLGSAASEREVRRLERGLSVVHFACHGILDEAVPLDSRLILAAPAAPADHRDDGRLLAWEILEDIRLDAELVVLSACQTGLGPEVGGEGLVGLTRAFHYAGARAVLSSLWNVADVSTARLMQYMYAALRRDVPPGEALQAAQILCIRTAGAVPGTDSLVHPFYWAGFVLSGRWQ